jgi:UDP-glucose 4-epimerase
LSKTLVTGGAGFIGSRLVRRLAADGRDTVVLDDLSTGRVGNLAGVQTDFIQGSILDLAVLRQAMRDADRVVHLAAIPSVPRSILDPVATHDANASGTLNVLEVARELGVEHVIVASSSSVYGANDELPKREQTWLAPMSHYAVSKLATEAYANAYGYAYGMKTAAFRFFNVYGPGQAADHAYAAVIPKFIDAALKDQPLHIEGDGRQTRDFTYVDTVCEALARCSYQALAPTGHAHIHSRPRRAVERGPRQVTPDGVRCGTSGRCTGFPGCWCVARATGWRAVRGEPAGRSPKDR